MKSHELQDTGIDLSLLVALQALLETANVTKAARRIGVSQPAMSHTLRRLRDMFGDPLLVRGSAGMVLTARALELRAPLSGALAELQRLIRRTQAFDPGSSTREFTLSATDFLQLLFLPQLVEIVAREAPGVQLSVRTVPVQQYAGMLESGEIDFMIGSVLIDEAPMSMRRELGRGTMICAVRRDHPDAGEALSLDQYTRLSHILVAPNSARGPGLVDKELAKLGMQRRIAVRLPSFLIAPWIVANSNHVLTAPQRVLEVYRGLLDLRLIEPPIELSSFPVVLLWHESGHLEPGKRWMRDAITRAYQTPLQGLPAFEGGAPAAAGAQRAARRAK